MIYWDHGRSFIFSIRSISGSPDRTIQMVRYPCSSTPLKPFHGFLSTLVKACDVDALPPVRSTLQEEAVPPG